METIGEARVNQISLDEQIEVAQQVSDWLMPYMYGVEIEPQELPLIVQARLSEIVGQQERAAQLRAIKHIFNDLHPDHKSNALLYLAGYPQGALSALADGDIDVTVALLVDAGDLFRPQQPIRRHAGAPVPLPARRPRDAREPDRPTAAVPDDWFVDPVRLGVPLPQRSADPEDNPLAWQDDALCAQTDPEAFFPEKGGSTRDAKRICTACEVKAQCLDYALENDERSGIWGGLSERERRRLRHARRA